MLGPNGFMSTNQDIDSLCVWYWVASFRWLCKNFRIGAQCSYNLLNINHIDCYNENTRVISYFLFCI